MTLSILCAKEHGVIFILNSIIIGLLSVVCGATIIYFSDGVDSVFDQLNLRDVSSFGRFVVAGYGCLLGALGSIIVKSFTTIKNKIA